MNKKVLTISIILFLAIAIIVGFLVWKNQCDEKVGPKPAEESNGQVEITEDVSEWKTYKSEEYGFEFQYPKNWRVDVIDSVVHIRTEEFRENLPEGGGSIKVKKISQGLEEFIKSYESMDFSKIVKNEEYDLNGESARKLTGTTAIGIDDNFLFIDRNGEKYLITFHEFDAEHMKILDTFGFSE